MLRTSIILGIVLTGSLAAAEPYQSPSRFGLGLELGAPTGLSAKYFAHGQFAVQGGIGVLDGWYDDGWHMHAEAVWHPVLLGRGPTVTVPLHVGVGGRLLRHDFSGGVCFDGRVYYQCGDTHLGVRAPIGVSFIFNKTPMDLFIEAALVVDVIHFNDDYMRHRDVGLDGALGGRFYF